MPCRSSSARRESIKAVMFLLLPILVLAGSPLLAGVNADPMIDMGWVDPKPTTVPPEVSILSLQNGTKCGSSIIKLTYEGAPIHGPTISRCNLIGVYYSASWQQDKVYVFKDVPYGFVSEEFSDMFELEEVPQGLNSITVTAVYFGRYFPYTTSGTHAQFSISGSSTVTFTVDLKPLRIGILTPYPQAYATSDVALIFTANEKTSKLQYSVEGEAPVAVAGNTTLTGLASGNHNVTVYGVDEFGNPGASETISFTITKLEAFPTTLFAAAVVAVVVVCAGLLLCFTKFKKRRAA